MIMDSDRALGVLVIIAVVVCGVLYFGSFVSPWWSLLGAIKVLVSAAFLAVLGIGAWIGWTMASTPSPEPMDDEELEDFDIDEEIEEPEIEEETEEPEEETEE